MNKQSLNTEEQYLLKRFGLSKRAILLYGRILEHGSLTAKEASNLSGEFPSAEYRLFKQLENIGLIRVSDGRPITFTAIPKKIGLKAAYTNYRSDLEKMIDGASQADNDQITEIIIGRQALYKRYIKLARQTEREICIYAIGIAFSGDLVDAQEEALKRDVRIRHVIQQLKPSNYHVVYKWQRLGVRLRYAPSERGFHFMLFDGRKALISFSNPENTEDRLSILTNNPRVIMHFKNDFQYIWANAQKVEV